MKKQILIVEDSQINQKLLLKILDNEYRILQAYDGKEALTLIAQRYEELAAVILDLHMPKMSGQELMKWLRLDKKYSNLPILVATGEDSKELERQCLYLGAWDFITKPYDAQIIRLRLHNIIARSQMQLMNEIKRLSERDHLTDLYNRRFFMEETKRMIQEHPDTTFALVRMDIDNFRFYNSSFGTKAGDKLLCYIAECMKRTVQPLTIYGRIQADVFCFCLPFAKEYLERELSVAEERIKTYSSEYRLKLVFGIYIVEDVSVEMEKMYSCATVASEVCKKNINKIYQYYTAEIKNREDVTQRLINSFDTAIKEQQFHVFLQPKYVLDSERVCGAEALVRWFHPKKGMITPGEFIPVFEQNGQIIELDYYMWESVCQLLHKWMKTGKECYPVSVNISRVSMYNPKIVEQLEELTDRYGIPKMLLNLEITESAYMSNPDLMKLIIQRLRQLGFVLLMDDFGSGYSSLNTLKDIDVDILKIDMKFLPTGRDNVKSEKILASIIRMAGWIGMPVVVEGVETKDQKDFLDSIGCSYVQGYYYAKPMPVEEYEALVDCQENKPLARRKYELKEKEILDAIWSSDTQAVALLKSISIPFAVLEYDRGQVELLRMNQSFIQEIGIIKQLRQFMNHAEWNKFLEAVAEAALNKNNSECECLLILKNGELRWYRIRLFFIGESVKTSIMSATFSNVTMERRLEQELNTVFGMIKGEVKKSQRILIIDDSEVSREILSNIFSEEYEILKAEDGQGGLALLEEFHENIAVILLDLMMPRMGGQEFLFYKNQMTCAADIPVVVISADKTEKTKLNMLENGVNDYVTKPFLSALVCQRVKNVLEYNSRFRDLLKEYRRVHGVQGLDVGNRQDGYSIRFVEGMIHFLHEVFELVRMVDPDNTSIINIMPDQSLERVPYSCFQIWGRECRCENCSSHCAKQGRCVYSKYELMKSDVFYVVSRPIKVIGNDGEMEELVLEVASRVSNEQSMKLMDSDSFLDIIENTQRMIYSDPLTNAFNRRFMEEMLFLTHNQNSVAKKVGFIMLDLYKFKQINDMFGHQLGDWVLQETVEAIKQQVRDYDSVIRYGGDEFFVVMTNCEEEHVRKAIDRIRKAMYDITYGANNNIHVEADFGYTYTANFKGNKEELAFYIKQADTRMYEDKRLHKQDN